MMSADKRHKTYPCPAIVVGVGRMGLGVLEQLGEDWKSLCIAPQDPTMSNLRLIHVRADGDDQLREWRDQDRDALRLSRLIQEGDLPTLALDLVLLRSLGLIRFRDGGYQVAIPVDRGVLNLKGPEGNSARRIRFFEWRQLDRDPIVAAEALYRLTERTPDMDLFLTPILNRIKGGFGPAVLIAAVSRLKAMKEGRDPSPWPWMQPAAGEDRKERCRACPAVDAVTPSGEDNRQKEVGGQKCPLLQKDICPLNWLSAAEGEFYSAKIEAIHTLEVKPEWLLDATDSDARPRSGQGGQDALSKGSRRSHLLDGFAPPPLPEWDLYRRGESVPMRLKISGRFFPRRQDLPSPMDPMHLLWVDWESGGWASQSLESDMATRFWPVPASPFRLGLFDHDELADGSDADKRSKELEELGRLGENGLLRLWIDLQRNHTEERAFSANGNRLRTSTDAALLQSLRILGDLVVEPSLKSKDRRGMQDCPDAAALSPFGHDKELPKRPTELLAKLELPRDDQVGRVRFLLEDRLQALGFQRVEQQDTNKTPLGPNGGERLLGTVVVKSEDVQKLEADIGAKSSAQPRDGYRGLEGFKVLLNQQTRSLLHYRHLSSYRNEPTRKPPRLTVFLVGDVAEPFVRATMRALLRDSHAELTRAFGPIFDTFRMGFDRPLDIMPILWMPHPADALAGEQRQANRCEEAAIIETVQGIRRWAECIPPKDRCVSQIFVNSRVTDNAVLGLAECIAQTRNFLTFIIRNDMARDEWLRATAVGPFGDDFFSSFSCLEADFPVERACEYLSNRLARDAMEWMRRGDHSDDRHSVDGRFLPPSTESMTRKAIDELGQETKKAGDQLAGKVRNRAEPATTTSMALQDAFAPRFTEELESDVQSSWMQMVESAGTMDSFVDELRQNTSRLLSETLGEVRSTSDELVQQLAAKQGLQTMQRAFENLRKATRRNLVDKEGERRGSESDCVTHGIPDTSPIERGRQGVVAAALRMPDRLPMGLGLAAWTVMAAVFGATIPWSISLYYGLNRHPGIVEFVLGPMGPLVGAVLFAIPVGWGLRWFRKKRIRAVKNAIDHMATNTRQVVDGTSGELRNERPCVRSFFQARLEFTAALAARGFTLGVQDEVTRDIANSSRIHRSVAIQEHLLERDAQRLGVRPGLPSGKGTASADDNVSGLFAKRNGAAVDSLVPVECLQRYYDESSGVGTIKEVVPELVARSGGFGDWRKSAVLHDTPRILHYCRDKFLPLITEPLPQQTAFIDHVGDALVRFVSRHYANVGFGASFKGYEGIDPDGIKKIADATLVLSKSLERLYREAEKRERSADPKGAEAEASTTATMEIETPNIRENVAYILSLVQGLRANCIRNLQRFESFHERPDLPEHRLFPLSIEARASRDGGQGPTKDGGKQS